MIRFETKDDGKFGRRVAACFGVEIVNGCSAAMFHGTLILAGSALSLIGFVFTGRNLRSKTPFV